MAYETPKMALADMQGCYVGSTPARRWYDGGTLVYQGFSPASEQEFIQKEATGGPAQLLKVYGKSIVNNQLVQASSQTLTAGGTTAIYTLDGKISITGSTTSSVFYALFISGPFVEGHKYYLAGCPAGGSNSSFSLRYNSNGFGENGDGKIVTYSTSQGTSNYMNREPIIVITNYTITGSLVFRPRLIDLTLRFGAGNEPTSVDEALRLLGGDAFDPTYDPGSLQSNKTAELRAERIPVINVWDEEWEVGTINSAGQSSFASDRIRSKNYIPIILGGTYILRSPSSGSVNAFYCYDAEYNYLGAPTISWSGAYYNLTMKPNTSFFRFVLSPAYGTTYNHDICINLSDPAINGTYYPHWRGKLTLNLSTLTGKLNGEGASVVVFPDGMRGVGTNRDEAYGSTAVQRIGSRAYQSGDESDPDVITDGTNTIYPLATPLTYTLDTPLPTDLTCVQGDILQRVSDNNCPFVGEMKFGL